MSLFIKSSSELHPEATFSLTVQSHIRGGTTLTKVSDEHSVNKS